ncbi:hypothetical protein pipiens_004289 [Culex pipiens pipiens]|uniref:Secreted protein n=2 Tax=Culex pipiens TaxID=7175 RepID=A0ABD1CK82_CULPP
MLARLPRHQVLLVIMKQHDVILASVHQVLRLVALQKQAPSHTEVIVSFDTLQHRHQTITQTVMVGQLTLGVTRAEVCEKVRLQVRTAHRTIKKIDTTNVIPIQVVKPMDEASN